MSNTTWARPGQIAGAVLRSPNANGRSAVALSKSTASILRAMEMYDPNRVMEPQELQRVLDEIETILKTKLEVTL